MCLTRKGYAKVGTFFVTSITLVKVRFTLLELIGILNPLGVALITFISDVRATSHNLDQVEKHGDEAVAIKRESFLDNPYKAPKESVHDMAETGSSGVNAAALHFSTSHIMAQNHSRTVLGAPYAAPVMRRGQEQHGSQKGPVRLARTGGASLCRPSTRDAVKAIPEIQTVHWVPTAPLTGAGETVSLLGSAFVVEAYQRQNRLAPERCADVPGLAHLGKL